MGRLNGPSEADDQASLENDPEMAKDLAEARKKMNSIMSGDAGAQ